MNVLDFSIVDVINVRVSKMKIEEIETFSNDELFSIILECQKELLKRGIRTNFEDLRLK